jgi:hypothetical protein
MNEIIHFLLVYNLAERKLDTATEFSDIDDAVRAYELAERQYLGKHTHEVVLLGADSLEAIMRTHGAYFELEAAGTPIAGLTAVMESV